ncbi:MAG: D-alanyl-D-alanine carboxypeptidase [Lachnospiraceae bacterium]|nr:D-alanyl-D-alanine carboxypeptidase [Lachnospiraceae bacterium]
MKRKFLVCIMAFTLLCSMFDTKECYAAEWPAAPEITSGAAILMDVDSKTILYGKAENEQCYPASITKIMTTMLALENSKPEDVITFSHAAIYNIDSGSTHIGMNEGEQIKMQDALYAVMLASANEVANGVAETVAGSNEKFAEMMNNKAAELGCKNTHFVNPHGLQNKNHYTTCYDMALISREALKNEEFRKIIGTSSYTIGETNLTNEKRAFTNHQQMLSGNKYPQYKYEGCLGGKTGYTSSANNTLVTFAERNGVTLVAVIMKSDFNSQYQDTIALMDYGFKNFKSFNILDNEKSDTFKDELSEFNKYFDVSKDDSACLYIDDTSTIILPNDAEYQSAKKEVKFFDNVELKAGENRVGEITYSYLDRVVGKHDIILNKTDSKGLPTIKISDKLKDFSLLISGSAEDSKSGETSANAKVRSKVYDFILVCFCLIIIFVVFLFFKMFIKKKRRKRAYNLRRRQSNSFWGNNDDYYY